MGKFYITTPIYYSNAEPHIGHAYATIISDVLARYHRSVGDETFFLTGTADHGQKIVQKAEEKNLTPQELTDQNVEKFKELYAKLGVTNDFFIRNSDQTIHWPGAQKLWEQLVEAGDIYKSTYKGLYCVGCEKFLTEKDLIDGKCPDHDKAPEVVEEENYFFRLSKYGERIRTLLESEDIKIYPESRKAELISFIDSDLEDVSFSRPVEKNEWGIPVPNDPSHTMYVWCEELSNYITALGYGREGSELFETLWPADLHVVGKDILRFHAILWPAMLISAGLELPRSILGTGLMISDGKKMSKTIGNVINPFELVDRYGKDGARFLLIRNVNPFEDTDITWEKFDEWYNAYLTNGLGNLVARVMQMATTHFDDPVELTDETQSDVSVAEHLGLLEFHHAMDSILERIGHNDALIALKKPFAGVKSEDQTEQNKAKEIINKLVRELYAIATDLEPFMPDTSAVIHEAVKNHKKPDNLFPRLS